MGAKERLMASLNKIVGKDPYINEVVKSSGIEIDQVEHVLKDIYKQNWFDTMTWGADVIAKDMGISFPVGMSIEDKRAIIEGRWKNDGKSDIHLLQLIADSWKNGEADIRFENGNIVVRFINEYGTPVDLDSLKKELDNAKPAHLPILFLYRYFLIEDIEGMTLEELETQKIDKFAFGGDL